MQKDKGGREGGKTDVPRARGCARKFECEDEEGVMSHEGEDVPQDEVGSCLSKGGLEGGREGRRKGRRRGRVPMRRMT